MSCGDKEVKEKIGLGRCRAIVHIICLDRQNGFSSYVSLETTSSLWEVTYSFDLLGLVSVIN